MLLESIIIIIIISTYGTKVRVLIRHTFCKKYGIHGSVITEESFSTGSMTVVMLRLLLLDVNCMKLFEYAEIAIPNE